MTLFKKDEEVPAQPSAQGTPTDQVLNLRSQGLTDNQIIQALQKDGFTSDQIFNGMSQADIKGGIETAPVPPQMDMNAPQEAPPQLPVMDQGFTPPPPPTQLPVMDQGFQNFESNGNERIEEIAEAIIDEKWNMLVKDINKIVEWKEEMNSKITKVETEVIDLRGDFDKLHKAIISKIDEYDKNLSDVGSEIKAMNQIFQKVLPTFTENINELSRITEKLSGK